MGPTETGPLRSKARCAWKCFDVKALDLPASRENKKNEDENARQEVRMTYHFSTTVKKSFDDAVAATKEALKRHNFHVISEINMKDNLKKGLNVEFRPYLILGACNPELTYRALRRKISSGFCYPAISSCSSKRTGMLKCPP
jgi:hypothetical protein